MNQKTILEIEEALKHHIINYNNPDRVHGKYLKIMDSLAYSYSGAPAIKVSLLINDYYKAVNVKNLDEAIKRLKDLELLKEGN